MGTEKQTFIEWLDETIFGPFKNWIFANYTNPFLWLGLFLVGLAIFGITYNALHKD